MGGRPVSGARAKPRPGLWIPSLGSFFLPQTLSTQGRTEAHSKIRAPRVQGPACIACVSSRLGSCEGTVLLTSVLWTPLVSSALWAPLPSAQSSPPSNTLRIISKNAPWRREWQPIPVFLPGESHGQRSLAGYSPWGCKKDRHDLTSKTTIADITFYSRKIFIVEKFFIEFSPHLHSRKTLVA